MLQCISAHSKLYLTILELSMMIHWPVSPSGSLEACGNPKQDVVRTCKRFCSSHVAHHLLSPPFALPYYYWQIEPPNLARRIIVFRPQPHRESVIRCSSTLYAAPPTSTPVHSSCHQPPSFSLKSATAKTCRDVVYTLRELFISHEQGHR